MTVQFNHRMLAYLICILTVVYCWRVVADGAPSLQRRAAMWFATGVLLQVLIVIWTLLAIVPVWLGGVHQFGAVVVLGLAVLQAHVAYHRDDKAVHQLG